MNDYQPSMWQEYMRQQMAILQQAHGLRAKIGLEVEFYLLPDNTTLPLDLLVNKAGFAIKKERGCGQYEFICQAQEQLPKLAPHLAQMKSKMVDVSRALGKVVSFAPKPKSSDYGSSLQVNISFAGKANYDQIASSICQFTPEVIGLLLPTKDDLIRLEHNYMAPTHVCYGQNNRTAMLRLVTNKTEKRLEHRLPSNNCQLVDVINSLLWSINKGLELGHKLPLWRNIYGNAYDEQYGLTSIAQLWQAQKRKKT